MESVGKKRGRDGAHLSTGKSGAGAIGEDESEDEIKGKLPNRVDVAVQATTRKFKPEMLLIIANVTKQQNTGTILRSASAFGCSGVIAVGQCASLLLYFLSFPFMRRFVLAEPACAPFLPNHAYFVAIQPHVVLLCSLFA